jgi:hypothetical protein
MTVPEEHLDSHQARHAPSLLRGNLEGRNAPRPPAGFGEAGQGAAADEHLVLVRGVWAEPLSAAYENRTCEGVLGG